MNLASILMAFLPSLLTRGDIDAAMAEAISGRVVDSANLVITDAFSGTPLYEVVHPEIYVRAALTFTAAQEVTLLDKDTDRAKGTISIDKGKIASGNYMLLTHIAFAWDQIATSSAGGATYENTKTGLEPELSNATIVYSVGIQPF